MGWGELQFSLLDYIMLIIFIVWSHWKSQDQTQASLDMHGGALLPFQFASLVSNEVPLFEGWRHCHWELT